MGGKAEAQPPTPTRAGSARQQGKKDAKGAADDKKEGKSIQDTAVYGEIVQNLVGLHEFGKEAAAARQDGDVQTGGIKESVVDGKKKVQKAAPAAADAPNPKPTAEDGKEGDDKGDGVKRKSNGRSGKKNLTTDNVAVLKEWYDKHNDWPYPAQADKQTLAGKTGLPEETVNNWFINARKRLMNAKDREKMAHSNPSKKPKLSGADALNSVAKGKQPKSAAAAPAPAAAAAPAAAPFTGVVVAAVPFPPGVIAAVAVPPIPVDADSAPPTGGMKE